MARDISDLQMRQLKKWMKDSAYTYTDEWFDACVGWIRENFSGATFEQVKTELVSQWKDQNLDDMESSCLPVNLAGQRLAKLTGKYGLQINSIRDIGESAYSQFTKIKKLENDNVTVAATDSNEFTQTWQPKPRRCLYLTLTDGSQKVYGMELQPIPGLSLNTKPGTKVTISGPVECRRGIFHLKSRNLKIEGGEVEDLQETNNADKIIIDIIDKLQGGTGSSSSTQSSDRGDQRSISNPTDFNDSSSSTSKTIKLASSAKSSTGANGIGKQLNILQYMKPMPLVIDPPTPERQIKRRRKSLDEGVPQLHPNDVNKDEFTGHFLEDDQDNTEMDLGPDDSLIRFVDEAVENTLANSRSTIMDMDTEICEDASEGTATSSIGVVQNISYPVMASDEPYIFIKQIQENLSAPTRSKRVVKVKACISTVVSNISIENGCWTLDVCINDGTGYLNCKISSNLLNIMVGCTPAEMKAIRASKTKEGKQKINQALAGLQMRLVHLNAILTIEMDEQPLILDIIDPMLHHSTASKDRLSQVGLYFK